MLDLPASPTSFLPIAPRGRQDSAVFRIGEHYSFREGFNNSVLCTFLALLYSIKYVAIPYIALGLVLRMWWRCRHWQISQDPVRNRFHNSGPSTDSHSLRCVFCSYASIRGHYARQVHIQSMVSTRDARPPDTARSETTAPGGTATGPV